MNVPAMPVWSTSISIRNAFGFPASGMSSNV